MPQTIATLAVSRHAQERMQQRGFTKGDIELVCNYGTPVADGFLVTRSDARELAAMPDLRQRGERLVGAAVIEQGGTIVTVFRANRLCRDRLPSRGRRPQRHWHR